MTYNIIFLLLIIYMIINKIYYCIIFLLIIFIIYYQNEIKKILNLNNFNISFVKNNIEKFINIIPEEETNEPNEPNEPNESNESNYEKYTDMFNDIDKLEDIARNNKTVITPFKNMVSELRNKFNIIYNKLNE